MTWRKQWSSLWNQWSSRSRCQNKTLLYKATKPVWQYLHLSLHQSRHTHLYLVFFNCFFFFWFHLSDFPHLINSPCGSFYNCGIYSDQSFFKELLFWCLLLVKSVHMGNTSKLFVLYLPYGGNHPKLINSKAPVLPNGGHLRKYQLIDYFYKHTSYFWVK